MAKDLSDKFNKGLMSELVNEAEEVASNDDDNCRDSELELPTAVEAEAYYTSQAWQRKIIDTVARFYNAQCPTKPNHSQPQQTTANSSQPSHINHLFTPLLSVLPLQNGNVTTWHFPLSY